MGILLRRCGTKPNTPVRRRSHTRRRVKGPQSPPRQGSTGLAAAARHMHLQRSPGPASRRARPAPRGRGRPDTLPPRARRPRDDAIRPGRTGGGASERHRPRSRPRRAVTSSDPDAGRSLVTPLPFAPYLRRTLSSSGVDAP